MHLAIVVISGVIDKNIHYGFSDNTSISTNLLTFTIDTTSSEYFCSSSKSSKSPEKKEEKKEVKKPEIKKEEAKKPEVKKPEEKKPNINTINKNNNKPEAKPMMSFASQLQAVNLKKVEPKESANANNVPEQKIKKILVNNRQNQNEMFTIKKKTENIEKKVKLNLKNDEAEKENNILKIKEQLKKNTLARSTADIKSATKKNDSKPAVSGFKNIKDMIEANIKKQRVMSQTAIRGGDKKKLPGK